MQAASAERYHRIEVPLSLSTGKFEVPDDVRPFTASKEFAVRFHRPEEEIA